MEFEYDPNKSNSNKLKHGIDFEEAQALWEDARYITLPSYSKDNEERYLAIGTINEKCWTVIYTLRFSTIRIISARRSRDKEEKFYEEN